jgi:hypothetical protein
LGLPELSVNCRSFREFVRVKRMSMKVRQKKYWNMNRCWSHTGRFTSLIKPYTTSVTFGSTVA